VKRNGDHAKKVFELLKDSVPSLKLIKIYGEYYGGVYPNVETSFKPIQKEIVYTADLAFEAFDLFYENTDGSEHIANYKLAVELFEKAQLPYAHILAEGTLKELMSKLNAETFESTIHVKHGLPKVDNNFAEGYVLKPAEAQWIDAQRVSIKLKKSYFFESAPVVKPPVKEAPKKKEVVISAED
jgi:hypothetical protein